MPLQSIESTKNQSQSLFKILLFLNRAALAKERK